MPVFRILLLLLVLGGLALFIVQNLSPVLPIVFLGMKSLPMKLGGWIFIAIALGFFTSLLWQFLSYLQMLPLQTRIRQLEGEPEPSRRRESSQTSYTTTERETSSTETDSDWDEPEPEDDDDWDIESPPEPNSRKNTAVEDTRSYEVKQEPKSSNVSGSVYSYGYREPKNSGVGKVEPVYDVNYRVIIPPYHETSDRVEEEDWGLEEDEEIE